MNNYIKIFPCQGTGVKDSNNGSASPAQSINISEYLTTREALWRLLATYPGDMPLVEALRQAPQVIFGRKEVVL